MAKQNPKWLNLIDSIADNWQSEDRSESGSKIDQYVMANIIIKLVQGRKLSNRQNVALIRSIQERARNGMSFEWEDSIYLTENQIKHARKSSIVSRITSKMNCGAADRVAKHIMLPIIPQSTTSQRSINGESTINQLPVNAQSSKTTRNPLENKGSRPSTIRYDTERYDTLRNGSCTRPIGSSSHIENNPSGASVGSSAHPQMKTTGSAPTSPAPVVLEMNMDHRHSQSASPYGSGDQPQDEGKANGIAEENGRAPETELTDADLAETQARIERVRDFVQMPDPIPQVDHIPAELPDNKPRIDMALWHHDDSQVTGSVTWNGRKFNLKFMTYSMAEAEIGKRAHDHVANRAWTLRMFEDYGRVRRDLEMSGRLHDHNHKHAASGLYGNEDSYANNPPECGRVMAMLLWDNEQPAGALIIDGELTYEIELKTNASKSKNAPHYKGKN